MTKETIKESLTAWAGTFENRDFNDGATARRWWAREFAEANAKKGRDLKEWALFMLECLGDFAESVYYLRDEVENFLKRVKRTAQRQETAEDKAHAIKYLKTKAQTLKKQLNKENADRLGILADLQTVKNTIQLLTKGAR